MFFCAAADDVDGHTADFYEAHKGVDLAKQKERNL
jgi:hypothetical protein